MAELRALESENVEVFIRLSAHLRELSRRRLFDAAGDAVPLGFLAKVADLLLMSEQSARLALRALESANRENDKLRAETANSDPAVGD